MFQMLNFKRKNCKTVKIKKMYNFYNIKNKKVQNRIHLKTDKNIVIFLLLCFLLCLPVISSAAIVKPTSQFYVNDYANILSSSTEQYIVNTSVELEQKTGAQIVVVTIPSLEGISIEEYANKLFNDWEIGDKEKDNGLLLICSSGDRLFRIEVGYGLEGTLPDGKTGRIQDQYIIPYLKQDNFDEGIKNGYSACLEEIAKEYNVTISGKQTAVKQKTNRSSFSSLATIIILIIFSIILRRFGGPFIFFRRSRWI